MREAIFRNEALARAEALRCLSCDDAPCRCGCPAGVDPRAFIRRIRFGNLAGAARALRRGNVMYGSCAYVCPSGTTCAARCTSEKLDRPIDIIGLQRFVADWERASGRLALRAPQPGGGAAVAVIGAGPAGLAAAAELALRGRRVVVFDGAKHAGGMLRRAVPPFRLPQEVLEHDVSVVERLGVEFRLGTPVRDVDALFADGFSAVFVASGTHAARPLGVPGENLPGVVSPLPLLEQARTTGAPEIGPRVVVIGGGDVAIDAARTAVRIGARATIAYRRDRAAMPAYAREVEAALAEGVEFLFSVVPEAILGEGRVAAIRLRRVRWDAPGRAAQRFETRGGPFDLETDSVVPAVGLAALPGATFGLETAPGGWIRTDPETGATSREGVFAGGDVATGPATAVAAVGQGRRAAAAIDAWLTGGARSGGSGQGRGGGRTDAEAPGRPPAMAGATGTASTSTSTSTSTSRVGGEGEIYEKPRADLSVTFCGVRFVNPFVLAAAPPTDDLDMVRAGFRAGWAGAVLKTTSVEGTPVPLAYPMMSSLEVDGRRVVGLGNIDLISEHHIDVVERRVATLKNEFPDRVVIASIMGAKKEDWQTLVRRLEAVGVDLIECSFSCPQGTLGNRPGAMLGQDAEASRTVAGWVKEAARRVPVVIKLTPQVADVVDVARAVLDAGADGICASNTIPSLMGIDLASFVPYPQVGGKSTYSGMSGPAIKPITLRCIAEIARRTGAQITGTGGPVAWSDAVELMLVGARTVQFCTAVMHHGFDIVDDLAEGLGDYLDRLGLARAGDLVGRTLPHIVGHDELPRGAKIRSRISPDLCVRCGVCVTACRDGGHRALTAAEDRAPRVDDLRCLGCGLCRLVCPVPGCVRVEVAG